MTIKPIEEYEIGDTLFIEKVHRGRIFEVKIRDLYFNRDGSFAQIVTDRGVVFTRDQLTEGHASHLYRIIDAKVAKRREVANKSKIYKEELRAARRDLQHHHKRIKRITKALERLKQKGPRA